MNENFQKVNQIMEALRLAEQEKDPQNPMMFINKYQITGEERQALITKLVQLLTE